MTPAALRLLGLIASKPKCLRGITGLPRGHKPPESTAGPLRFTESDQTPKGDEPDANASDASQAIVGQNTATETTK